MQIIHSGGFDKTLASSYKRVLLSNIIAALKGILETGPDLHGPNIKRGRWIVDADVQTVWDEELVDRVKTLWDDEAVKEAWVDVRELVLVQMDYLMDNLDRFMAENFEANNDDILRARIRSTGETTTRFEESKNIWHLVDVGGQYSEREKWNNIAETVEGLSAVLFFIALDEFNVPNPELKSAEHKTKMDLALSVFEEVMNNVTVCRIVFLNKVDLFQKKLEEKEKFNEFKKALGYNGDNDTESCTNFVQETLLARLTKKDSFHVHVTNGLDTELIKTISAAIKEAILSAHLGDFGIM